MLSNVQVPCCSLHLDEGGGRRSAGQRREPTEADALDKLCLSSVLRLIQIFNTALQDLKKICRIRGCKPGPVRYIDPPCTESCIQFPNY